MDKDCLFCKIAAKDISASIVYEDSHVIAFLDISQLVAAYRSNALAFHARDLWPQMNCRFLFEPSGFVTSMIDMSLYPSFL